MLFFYYCFMFLICAKEMKKYLWTAVICVFGFATGSYAQKSCSASSCKDSLGGTSSLETLLAKGKEKKTPLHSLN